MRIVLYRKKWALYWTEGGKSRRRSLGTSDRGQAERIVADLERRDVRTCAEIFQAYKDERGGGRAGYAWKALKPAFGHLRPDQVTRALCRAYATSRRRAGRQNGTIIKELSIFRAALRWHDKNTPAKLEFPKSPPPKDRYLTKDEARALIAAATMPHIVLFIILALATAARKSALLELIWDRIDFKRGLITLSTGQEGKRRAEVPMNKNARQALSEAGPAALSEYVIEYAGKQVGDIKKGFAAACERAGLEGVTPHVLRHTAAVWMAEAGVPMAEIAQYMGHTNPQITFRVYARFSPEYLAEAAKALEF